MSFLSLCQLVPPPKSPVETGSPKRWKKAEERLGVSLPEEYKTFIDCYGTGNFSDLIFPYNPFAKNEYLNLYNALDTHHQASRMIRTRVDFTWSIVHPFELYPASEGLLPWGTTAHFEVSFFWQVKDNSESWETILYDLRNGEYEVWKLSFIFFLHKLLSGEIESLLLPELLSLKSRGIAFHPCREDYSYG